MIGRKINLRWRRKKKIKEKKNAEEDDEDGDRAVAHVSSMP